MQPEPEPTTTISEPNDGGALPTHASHRTAATSTPVAALDSAAASGTVIGLLSESRESAEVNSVAHLAYDRLQDALISAAPSVRGAHHDPQGAWGILGWPAPGRRRA